MKTETKLVAMDLEIKKSLQAENTVNMYNILLPINLLK